MYKVSFFEKSKEAACFVYKKLTCSEIRPRAEALEYIQLYFKR